MPSLTSITFGDYAFYDGSLALRSALFLTVSDQIDMSSLKSLVFGDYVFDSCTYAVFDSDSFSHK